MTTLPAADRHHLDVAVRALRDHDLEAGLPAIGALHANGTLTAAARQLTVAAASTICASHVPVTLNGVTFHQEQGIWTFTVDGADVGFADGDPLTTAARLVATMTDAAHHPAAADASWMALWDAARHRELVMASLCSLSSTPTVTAKTGV